MVKWHNEFRDRGLVIIDVDHGGIDSLESLQRHVAEAGIEYSVLHDSDGVIVQRYGVTAFPTAYLIGRDGRIVWAGIPSGSNLFRKKIEAALVGSDG